MNGQHVPDGEIQELLRSLPAGGSGSEVNPAMLERIRQPILADMQPVSPLPGTRMLALGFGLLFVAMVALCSSFLGFAGLRMFSLVKGVLVCGLLLTLGLMASVGMARGMRPGARRFPGWVLPTATLLASEALFAALLRDYKLGRFLFSGLICLSIGTLCSLASGLLAYLWLRRGYVAAPVATGTALGVGAGLVGLTVIEFHCPIETFPHVAVWHVGIVILAASIGALGGAWTRNSYSRR